MDPMQIIIPVLIFGGLGLLFGVVLAIASKVFFVKTEESVAAWRKKGLGVRAWGIKDTTIMKRMCALGVDGMTVNFPDKLTALLENR